MARTAAASAAVANRTSAATRKLNGASLSAQLRMPDANAHWFNAVNIRIRPIMSV
jgi:hypothetical protein